MHKCLIIDDEPLARQILREHIEKISSLQIVGECKNALIGNDYLQNYDIDLIFLDVRMPGLSGIEFLTSLRKPPKVILTTAYREYALEAFDLDVVDYLVKPISLSRLIRAVNKVQQVQTPKMTPPSDSENQRPFIFFKINNRRIKVNLGEILYIESDKDYCKVFRDQAAMLYVYKKISYLEEKLPQNFMRVHRSFIVAINKITAYTNHRVDIGETIVPIGRLYQKKVIEALESSTWELI